MDEKEKMIAGMVYDTSYKQIDQERVACHNLCLEFNSMKEDDPRKGALLKKLLPNADPSFALLAPCHLDYGYNLYVGKNCFANFGLTVLDTCKVSLGDDVFLGPNVSLVTPIHPLLNEERKMRFKEDGTPYDLEYASPIEIGSGTWIASNVVVGPGVKIGRNCVIGMGSVVTKDIPDGYLAYGNPCKPIRKITESDSIYNKERLWEHEQG